MALDPETSQKIEQIVKEFKDSPHFSHNDIVNVILGYGEGPLVRACFQDDGRIDSIEDSLITWYVTVYQDKFRKHPNFANDVLIKLAQLQLI